MQQQVRGDNQYLKHHNFYTLSPMDRLSSYVVFEFIAIKAILAHD